MLWVILLAFIVIGWMLATYTSGQNQSRHRPGKRSTSGTSASERQLRKRVGPSTAERLINHAAQKHPDRSRAWCADKALHELKRDYRG
ncbi:hypothetical protein [Acaryochloris thomasi]|uniref:hypothetical protein n=1 Tax=Acaryochloris thomasi TaxID=2929456 RepID=UPI000DA64C24|nr:hypothetical protein [Acaryochloris thomasi]